MLESTFFPGVYFEDPDGAGVFLFAISGDRLVNVIPRPGWVFPTTGLIVEESAASARVSIVCPVFLTEAAWAARQRYLRGICEDPPRPSFPILDWPKGDGR